MSKKKIVVMVAALFGATLGFAKTYVVKTGKVTALTLDEATKTTTVTVTFGDLQEPSFPNGGHPMQKQPAESKADIITLGTETQSFVLSSDIVVESYQPFFMPCANGKRTEQNHAGERQMADRRTKDARQGSMQRPHANPMGANGFPFHGEMQVGIGNIVQLVFAEDGTTIERIQILPNFQPVAAAPDANSEEDTL